jgi:hypothetical protein
MSSHEFKSKTGKLIAACKLEFIRAVKLGQSLVGAGFLNDKRSTIHRELGEWLVTQIQLGKVTVSSDYIEDRIIELKKLDGKIELLDQEIRELKSPCREDGVAP